MGIPFGRGLKSQCEHPIVQFACPPGDSHGHFNTRREVKTGRLVTNLKGHSEEVSGVAFRPDGKHLASISAAELKIWEVATWKEAIPFPKQMDGGLDVAYSPDSQSLAVAKYDESVRIVEVDSGK